MALKKVLNQQGFTLIEILVVITIMGVIVTITGDVFLRIIRASNKANVVSEIKQNGDAVLNQVERIVRNAEEVTSFGTKTYGGSWTWIDKDSFDSATPESCSSASSDICAIILKNPPSIDGYTKLEIHKEKDKECNVSPFTASDKDENNECNGNIRIVTDITSGAITNLQTSSEVGQIVTNTEKVSGISVNSMNITLRTATEKPSVITLEYTMTQGIKASSRIDAKASVPFETTISLRNY